MDLPLEQRGLCGSLRERGNRPRRGPVLRLAGGAQCQPALLDSRNLSCVLAQVPGREAEYTLDVVRVPCHKLQVCRFKGIEYGRGELFRLREGSESSFWRLEHERRPLRRLCSDRSGDRRGEGDIGADHILGGPTGRPHLVLAGSRPSGSLPRRRRQLNRLAQTAASPRDSVA